MRPPQFLALFGLSVVMAGCATEPKLTYAHPCSLGGELRVSAPIGDRLLRGRDSATTDWYPQRALELGKGGLALVRCDTAQAKLVKCRIAAEEPVGLGFGTMALKLASQRSEPGDNVFYPAFLYRWTPTTRRCRDFRTIDPIAVVTQKPEPKAEKSR
jgi:hypothetical protein